MARIEKSNTSYQVQANKHKRTVVFLWGDPVWIHIKEEHFPKKGRAN